MKDNILAFLKFAMTKIPASGKIKGMERSLRASVTVLRDSVSNLFCVGKNVSSSHSIVNM